MIQVFYLRQRGLILAITVPLLLLTLLVGVITAEKETNAQSRPQLVEKKELEAIESFKDGLSDSDMTSTDASCRLGVTAPVPEHVQWVDDLDAGWFVYFGGFSDSATNGAEIVPVISVAQKKDANGNYLDDFKVNPPLINGGLGNWVDSNPGFLWMVGNEVDRGPNPDGVATGQGDTFPEVYARAYHDVYYFIKDRDPTAQVTNAGLVEATPGRLQYLDIVWHTYLDLYGEPMPVDVWNMHIYILPEVSPDGQPNGIANVALGTDPGLGIRESGGDPAQCSRLDVYCVAEHDDMTAFDQQVRAMRSWMSHHGQQNKPLILSEFSLLYPYIPDPGSCWVQDEYGDCFTQDRVIRFLNNTASYFETAKDHRYGYPLDDNRLIQQTAWFSINNGRKTGDISNLVSGEEDSLVGFTPVGQRFQVHANSAPLYVNLALGKPATPAVRVVEPKESIDVDLWVDVANNGNLAITESFSVTFYTDIQRTEVIGTVMVQATELPQQELAGCARRQIRVGVKWTGLMSGTHPYWVEVDSSKQIEENGPGANGEKDNVAMGFVFVDQERAFFPIIPFDHFH